MTTYGDRLEAAVATEVRVELAVQRMSQKALAEAVGVGREALNNYLNGHRDMPMPVFIRIAEALGLTAQELMQRAEARLR
jgi:plasmid maintenance system antidote protein VapI